MPGLAYNPSGGPVQFNQVYNPAMAADPASSTPYSTIMQQGPSPEDMQAMQQQAMNMRHSQEMFPGQLQQQGLQTGMMKAKSDFLNKLLGGIGGMMTGGGRFGGGFGLNSTFGAPPAPNYVSGGPVYTQGQINAQSNLQRANLQQQGASTAHQLGNQYASQGFSPVASPFVSYAQQNAMLKANSGAAQNETNLNWTAAQANKNAELDAAKVNASLYGDWLNSLMQGQNLGIQEQRTQQDYFLGLLNAARGM